MIMRNGLIVGLVFSTISFSAIAGENLDEMRLENDRYVKNTEKLLLGINQFVCAAYYDYKLHQKLPTAINTNLINPHTISTLENVATQNLKNVYSQWDTQQLMNGENRLLKGQNKDFIIGYKIAMTYQMGKSIVRENFQDNISNSVSPKVSEQVYDTQCKKVVNRSI